MIVGSMRRKKKKPEQPQAMQQPKRTSPVVAWVVLIVIWFLTAYPLAMNMVGGTAGLIAAVAGLFVLKSIFLNKLREVLP